MNTQKIIRNIIGKGKIFGGKNDLDGDGVLNEDDCQKLNTMRQDAYSYSDAFYDLEQQIIRPNMRFIMEPDVLRSHILAYKKKKMITQEEADQLFDMMNT